MQVQGAAGHRLVLGLGGCVDLEVAWDAQRIEDLARQHGITVGDLDPNVPVEDERSLLCCILAFVRDGVGGERFTRSSEIGLRFAEQFPFGLGLGGTGVRAAIAIAKLGVPGLVHLTSINDTTRRLLPPEVDYLCSAEHDSYDPHLIVQFPGGARIRLGSEEIRSAHPNRVIFVNDPPNRDLLLHPGLPEALSAAQAFLPSGFNMMRDPDLALDRVEFVLNSLRRLPAGAVVYYEDAGFHDEAIRSLVHRALTGSVGIHGLNEDELQGYLERRVDLLDPEDVASALTEFAPHAMAPCVVVHTKYWALAHGENPGTYEQSLRRGVDLASTRYCHGDDYTAAELAEIGHTPSHVAGRRFAAELSAALGERVCCVPSRQLQVDNPTTIGLGDTFVGGFLAALLR